MDNHPGTTTHLQVLLNEFYTTGECTSPVIKHELLSCYYSLTAQERLMMRSVMRPFIDEIEQEMLNKDSMTQEARDLLSRLTEPVHIAK